LSTELANLVPAVLQDRSNRVRREGASGLRSYVNDQLAQSEARLKDSEDKLRAYKESHKVSSLEGESAETLQKLTQAEILLNTTRSDRAAAERSLRAVRGTIATQRQGIVPNVTNTASLSSQGMKQRLVTLQQQYAQLSVQGYASDHPRMVQLRQEITQAKQTLATEAANLTRSGATSDPIATLDQYSQQALALQVQVQSLRAREASLQRTVSEYKGQLTRLPNLEVGLARLTRERDANQKTYTSLLDNRESIRVAQGNQVPNARVVDWAEVPQDPIFPRKLLNLALALVLGLMVGSGVGLYQESGRTGLRSVVVFEDQIGWPVLARVPAARLGSGTRSLLPGGAVEEITDGDSQRALVSYSDPASDQGEAYFMLRTRLELLGFGTKYRSLLVTSTAPRDGKSSTLCNLATTFGTAGRSALVVDAELRRPVIHRYFGVNQWPGLSDLLLARNGNGNHDATPVQPPKDLFQPTLAPGVDVLACGRRMTEFEWESTRPQMGALLEELKSRYDVLLVDSAPPVLVHDTLALCSLVDAVIVVVNAKRYDTRHLIETKRLLEQAGANILGVVINRVESYGTYSYYYDRRYGPREPGDSPMTSRS
jgi:succinoglycan biosynthesis transport protein ExoP